MLTYQIYVGFNNFKCILWILKGESEAYKNPGL